MRNRINPKLLGQALDLCIPLRLRQLGAEVCHLSQERGCGQSRIRAERTALPLLLQSCLTLFIGLQGTKGPNGPVAQGVGREAVVLGNLSKGLLGILARRESLRQLLKGWNKRVHHQVPPAKHNPKLTRSPLGGSSMSPGRTICYTGFRGPDHNSRAVTDVCRSSATICVKVCDDQTRGAVRHSRRFDHGSQGTRRVAGHGQGCQRQSDDRLGRAVQHALLVQDPLRERAGHEPRRADRCSSCWLLHHGARLPAPRGWLCPTELATEAAVSLEKEGQGFRISKSALTLHAQVPGIERDRFAELARAAEKTCPVSKVLNAEITMDFTLA